MKMKKKYLFYVHDRGMCNLSINEKKTKLIINKVCNVKFSNKLEFNKAVYNNNKCTKICKKIMSIKKNLCA